MIDYLRALVSRTISVLAAIWVAIAELAPLIAIRLTAGLVTRVKAATPENKKAVKTVVIAIVLGLAVIFTASVGGEYLEGYKAFVNNHQF